MAVCMWCNHEMEDPATVDCLGNTEIEFPDSITMASVPFDHPYNNRRCPDCGVKKGQHHHPGCDMERCPRCKGQLIGCGCLDEDDEEEKFAEWIADMDKDLEEA